MTIIGTTSANEWQQVTTNDNKRQKVVMSETKGDQVK